MALGPYGYRTSQGVEKGTAGAGGPNGFALSEGYSQNAPLLGEQRGFAENQAQRYSGMATAADARGGPYMDRSQDLQSRGYVQEGIGMLGQRALGLGWSPGEQMAARAGMAAQGAQYGMANSYRGGPAMQAMAARNAANQIQGIGTQTSLEMARMRANEMEQARNQLFQATSGLRGQDIGQAQQQADIDLMARAGNDQRALGFLGMEQKTWENQRAALMAQQQMLLGDSAEAQARLDRQQAANDAYQQGITNRVVGFGMGAMQGGVTAMQGMGGSPQPRPGGGGYIDRNNPYGNGNDGYPTDWRGIY